MHKYLYIILNLLLLSLPIHLQNEYASKNFDTRVKYIVIHFTSQDLETSLDTFLYREENPVSTHYLITDKADDDILNLVDENFRAWHAGKSFWREELNLNDSSIGIEIVNTSGCNEKIININSYNQLKNTCNFEDFKEFQIRKLIMLIKEIRERHSRIEITNVIGHSDIAVERKLDPGPLFPWYTLYINNVGAWYDNDDYLKFMTKFSSNLPEIKSLQLELRKYGYKINNSGVEDLQSQKAVRAFQMHFRPSNYDGYFDIETAAILYALNHKYRSE